MAIQLFVFAVFSFLSPDVLWTGAETEVYRPLVAGEVAVAGDGRTFIVQRAESSVVALDAVGKLSSTFGSKGQGPGEFQIPTWIHLDDRYVYVEDVASRSVSTFKHDGSFVKRHTLPKADLALVKVKGGWVYGDWDSSDDQAKAVNLVFVDETVKAPKMLLTWPRKHNDSNVQVRSDGRSKPKVPINPASDITHLAASSSGDHVFLVKQGSQEVLVIEVATGKVVKKQSLGKKAVPFNTRWGEAYLTEFVEGQSDTMRAMIDFVGKYPDTFPIVRRMRCLPNGFLLIEYWTNHPDKKAHFEAYDANLKPLELGLTSATLARLVHVDGDKIWLMHYDGEDEIGRVVCLPKKEGDAFVANHPIEYEGLTGHDIVVERH